MEILRLEREKLSELLVIVARDLKKGKVVAIPTDTIYGLIADASNEKAVMKIFKIKKRPESKVLPIFVKDIKMAKQFAKINKRQENFLKKYWPGKVTVVLERKGRKKIYGVDKKTIGLRVPDSKIIKAIISKIKKPLVQTSVNISGQPSINDPKKISEIFSGKKFKPDLIINNGPIKEGLQSTLVDLTGEEFKILREGAIKIKWNAKV